MIKIKQLMSAVMAFATILMFSWNTQGNRIFLENQKFDGNNNNLYFSSLYFPDDPPTTCEYFKAILDNIAVKNSDTPTKSGLRPYTIFVISPGNRKSSNAKIARKMIKFLNKSLRAERYNSLQYVIIETKRRKGIGHIQIYFMDELTDLPFSEDTLECP